MAEPIRTGISYMYEPAFNRTILPLLHAGEIDAIEWSFDTVKSLSSLPAWTVGLLKEYGDAGRLYGHGVYYSMLSGAWHERHSRWFEHLEEVLATYRFQHISEHFGFMTSSNAHEGAPLPVPFCEATQSLGVQRLKLLAQAVKMPVGIENLALSFSLKDVEEQGRFLETLITPTEGFILLDLHNIYCQAANFGVDPNVIVDTYPLDRVKEIHVSGGSWEHSAYAKKPVRRDTHDHAIPEEVFHLLKATLPKCPNLEVVIFERLGDSFTSDADQASFQEDFLQMKALVNAHGKRESLTWPFMARMDSGLVQNSRDIYLAEQQAFMLDILRTATTPAEAMTLLNAHPDLDHELWRIQDWQITMIETAMQLGVKWGLNGINQH